MEGRSRSGVPQEVRPVVPVTTSSPRFSFRARSSHCQVLALPLTHSPEGGSQWCQITPGEPTPRLPGVCGCTCVWCALRHRGAMWVAVERCRWKCRLVQYRLRSVLIPDHFLADDAKDDGYGVVLPLGLQPYSSPYLSPYPHAILTKRKSTSTEQSKRLAPTVMMKLYTSTLVRGA